ncbi:hypothetical protein LTR67_001853 [Exophiala xenobiotica]
METGRDFGEIGVVGAPCSEIFPTPLRAQGTGFSVAGLFTATLIYTQTAPVAFAQVGWKFYIIFIILPLLGAGLMWKFFPETKLLTLEEISRLFGDEVALDINQLSTEEKLALDREVAKGGEGVGVASVTRVKTGGGTAEDQIETV